MLLKLHPVGEAPPLSVSDGVYAHAALLHTISTADAKAGRVLHEMHHQKWMTLALLERVMHFYEGSSRPG
jgi:hypothetical protein